MQAITTRKETQRRTTQGGATFEDALGNLLGDIASGAGDMYESTGANAGNISMCKVGDFVITLGKSCSAAAERLVVEAKRNQKYNLEKALEECKTARKNRGAQVALFVWDKEHGEAKHQPPLARYDKDIVVLWTEDDPNTEIYVRAAYWLARNMIMPQPANEQAARVKEKLVADAFEQIEKLINMLEDIKKSGEKVVKEGEKIKYWAYNVQTQLEAQVNTLRNLVMSQAQDILDE